MPTPPPVTPARLLQFSWAFAIPLLLDAAVRNGLFEALAGGPKTAAELAAESAVSERGARAVLNALTSVDLLTKDSEGRYGLTAESAAFLGRTSPAYLGGVFRHASVQLMPRWLALNEVVRTGRPAPYDVSDDGRALHFQEFVEDIMPLSFPAARALAETLVPETSEAPMRVLDIGAGSGVWGIALAERGPGVRVTAVDWPQVLDVTLDVAARYGVGDRFEARPGDLFAIDFGDAYQAAVLGHVLHSFGEARNRALIAKVFDALAPGGVLAIADFLVDDAHAAKTHGLIFAVNMLVNTEEGDTFSFAEIAGWLTDAGFANIRALEAPGPAPLILADRPR